MLDCCRALHDVSDNIIADVDAILLIFLQCRSNSQEVLFFEIEE